MHEPWRVAVRRMGRRRTVGIAQRCRAFPIVDTPKRDMSRKNISPFDAASAVSAYFSISEIDRWMNSVRFLPLSIPLVSSARSMICRTPDWVVGPFWPFRPPVRVMTPLQTSLFSLHVVLADTSSKPYVACATSWFALHGNRRWPGPSQPIFRLLHARLEFPGHSDADGRIQVAVQPQSAFRQPEKQDAQTLHTKRKTLSYNRLTTISKRWRSR